MFAIKISDLTKKFDNITALNKLNLEIREGEFFGFLGPNGAGKTTLINIVTTLLAPTSGTAEIAGFDIYKNKREVRKNIGIVFQVNSSDDKLTAKENLLFHGWLYKIPKKELNNRIIQLLKIVGLSERQNDLVGKFSGGMKRRLEIARGLLHNPKVLFLDEPTVGLDPQTRSTVWRLLEILRKTLGTTVFFTTHYLDEAEACDRIGIIDHGQIIANGTLAELKSQTQSRTLNEIFLKLTGHEIRD